MFSSTLAVVNWSQVPEKQCFDEFKCCIYILVYRSVLRVEWYGQVELFLWVGVNSIKICSYVLLWQRCDDKVRKIIWWCIDFFPIAVIRYSDNISVRPKEFVFIHNSRNRQSIVVGKSRRQKAEVAVVTSRLQACRSAPSFRLQSPGPKPHRMAPPIADRPSHLNLHNQDYLPQTQPNARFPGDSRLKFTINPNHQRWKWTSAQVIALLL